MQQDTKRNFSFSALKRHYENPYKIYDDLRSFDAIYYDQMNQCWIVTDYAAIISLLEDPRFTSDLSEFSPASAWTLDPIQAALGRQLFFKEGQEHEDARLFLLQQLSPMLKKKAPELKTHITRRWSRLAEKGSMEIIHDFASPVAFSAVAHLLGVPLSNEEELLQLMQWSHTFSDVVSGYLLGNTQEVFALKDYFHRLVEQKRRNPSYDLISSFIEAKKIFTDDDTIVASCMMVLSAGHVTTKKLLGTGISKMLDQWEDLSTQLPANPGLLKTICEELLRTGTPTRYIVRWAREDVDLAPQFPGEHFIQQGQKVLLFLEAGNYDPAFFPHPQQFVAQRHPNKHITFGHGKHKCPGASLARLETHTALELLLRFANLQPDQKNPPQWNPNPNLGGFQTHSLLFCPIHTSSNQVSEG